jgi:hypothetical protein
MDPLSIFALVILIVIAVLICAAIWMLGSLPGKVAAERDHPYASAIQVGGWATLFLGIVIWPLVLMWAYCGPVAVASSDSVPGEPWQDELDTLKTKVDTLARQIQESGGKQQ